METSKKESQEDLIELATQVYDVLSDKQIDEIEQIAISRNFFPDEIIELPGVKP